MQRGRSRGATVEAPGLQRRTPDPHAEQGRPHPHHGRARRAGAAQIAGAEVAVREAAGGGDLVRHRAPGDRFPSYGRFLADKVRRRRTRSTSTIRTVISSPSLTIWPGCSTGSSRNADHHRQRPLRLAAPADRYGEKPPALHRSGCGSRRRPRCGGGNPDSGQTAQGSSPSSRRWCRKVALSRGQRSGCAGPATYWWAAPCVGSPRGLSADQGTFGACSCLIGLLVFFHVIS